MNTSASSAGKTKISLHGNLRSKVLYHSKCTLKSHFDSVRGLQFLTTYSNEGGSQGHALVSASEDCTLKIWDASKFSNYKELSQVADGNLNLEPYITLRGHTKGIVSLSARDLI